MKILTSLRPPGVIILTFLSISSWMMSKLMYFVTFWWEKKIKTNLNYFILYIQLIMKIKTAKNIFTKLTSLISFVLKNLFQKWILVPYESLKQVTGKWRYWETDLQWKYRMMWVEQLQCHTPVPRVTSTKQRHHNQCL